MLPSAALLSRHARLRPCEGAPGLLHVARLNACANGVALGTGSVDYAGVPLPAVDRSSAWPELAGWVGAGRALPTATTTPYGCRVKYASR